MPSSIPGSRLRSVNDRPVRPDGGYVLYWMVAARRRRANFGLQRAVGLARAFDRPLVVLEALRCDYRWASDRLHAFVLQGMACNRADFARKNVCYLPYVEPAAGAGRGLLAALSAHACAVVTDDAPWFFLPRMLRAAAAQLTVRLEAVDGNGLLPMRAADRVFQRAFDFRRFLQRTLPAHLSDFPLGDPLRGYDMPLARLPDGLEERWPVAGDEMLSADAGSLAQLPIDHTVAKAPLRGGAKAAGVALRAFLANRLDRYGDRNHPDREVASGLSPYLHFGHLSSHQVFAGIARREEWSLRRIHEEANGRRGWFGMSEPAEGFLDQLVTWRELGLNRCWQSGDYASYGSLPSWARDSLAAHATDAREQLYSVDELARARTVDPVWNAAQQQLRQEGVMHNYLRMLWGKKVIEWSQTPEKAFEALIELNDRYALDGRDPNSYCGISWVFGRYDRPWAPERLIFGRVRYMSSASTVRKLRMKEYLARWGE